MGIAAAGWAAFALGAGHAAVSIFWALGGTAGLDLLGGSLEDLSRERSAVTVTTLLLVAVVKLAAAVLGPALLRPPGSTAERAVRTLAWMTGGVLTAYGGLLALGGVLVETGVVEAAADADRTALRGHLYLWDPWFLVWGALLLVAVRGTRSGRRRE